MQAVGGSRSDKTDQTTGSVTEWKKSPFQPELADGKVYLESGGGNFLWQLHENEARLSLYDVTIEAEMSEVSQNNKKERKRYIAAWTRSLGDLVEILHLKGNQLHMLAPLTFQEVTQAELEFLWQKP